MSGQNELDWQAIAHAFNARRREMGWTKPWIAQRAGLKGTRTLDKIGAAVPVSSQTLTKVSRAMFDGHHDALERAGRGLPPVEEEPDVAAAIHGLAGRFEDVARMLEEVVAYVRNQKRP